MSHENSNETPTRNHGSFIAIAIMLAIVGLGISLYSTNHHITVKEQGYSGAFCNINSTLNCDEVAQSRFAELLGVPLGVWGSGYFLALLLLLVGGKWKPETEIGNLSTYTILAFSGVAVSVILAGISVFSIGSLCLTCIGIYVVCFAQAGLWFKNRNTLPSDFSFGTISNSGSLAAVGLIVPIAIYNFFGPQAGGPPAELVEKEVSEKVKTDPVRSLLAPMGINIKIDQSPYSGMGEDFRKGNDRAKVQIVEFADFQCPACKGASTLLDQVYKEYGSSVLVVFKNYPLDRIAIVRSKENFTLTLAKPPFSLDALAKKENSGSFMIRFLTIKVPYPLQNSKDLLVDLA